MGTVIQNSTLRALILEAFSSDKSLMQDIFETVFKENPHLIEEFSAKNQASSTVIDELDPHFPVLEGLSAEREKWLNEAIDKDFAKYHDVFKALA
jgi:hypothetical protein